MDTIFVIYSVNNGIVQADVYGEFNGINLSPDSVAAVGTGTDGYDENDTPNGTQSGTTTPDFNHSALEGGGSLSYNGNKPQYPVLEGEYIDSQKFWDFCQSIENKESIRGINVVATYKENATDISVSGDGYIVAFVENNNIYITAAHPDPEKRYDYYLRIMPQEDSSYLFDFNKTGLPNIEKISMFNLYTAHVKNMEDMFKDNQKLKTVDIAEWDTKSVENFKGFLSGNPKLQMLKITKWNTENAKDMSYMFADCSSLKALDTSAFNTGKVEHMSYMFYNCATLQTLNISSFKTQMVQDMISMFEGCLRVGELDVAKFDVSSLVSFKNMFKDCRSVQTLNVGDWETSAIQDMSKMFMNCKKLTGLTFDNWDTSNVKDMSQMLYGCENLEELDLTNINNLSANNVSQMLDKMYRLRMVTIGARFSFRGSGVSYCVLPTPSEEYIEDADGFYKDENGISYAPQNIPGKVAATYHAVSDTLPAVLAERDTWWKGSTPKSSITRIKIVNKYRSWSYDEKWNADEENSGSIVVYVEGTTAYLVNNRNRRAKNAFQLSYDATNTFAGFSSLREIEGLQLINLINTSIADNFFQGCMSLKAIDGYQRWNVQNLRSISSMFADTQISFLQLGGWDLASITNLSTMFKNTKLTEINLSHWEMDNVTTFEGMF